MKLQGVEAAFGKFNIEVNLSLSGGVTGIFGNSGAGKTTLLEIIAGLKRPRRGRLLFQGEVLFDMQSKYFVPARKRKIGYVPQDLALFPHLTAEDNIRYAGNKDSSGLERFREICRIFEIEKNLAQLPHSLSGGEKQRVAFARALMAQPSMLLLDEPLRGLHHEMKMKMLAFLSEIKQQFNLPMLYVTHSPSEVMALCDEVVFFEEGRGVGQGKPSDYFCHAPAPLYELKPMYRALS